MSGEDAATRLAAMQAELVRTLAGQAGTPRGFDYTRLEATAEALRKKRATAVARLWPGLACGLGDRYPHRFAAFAAQTPLPCAGGALADGRAFARWLARAGELSEQGRLETLAVDLRYTHKGGVLVRRRGPALLMAALSNPRRLVLFFRLPWIGERWLSLRLWGQAAVAAVCGRLAAGERCRPIIEHPTPDRAGKHLCTDFFWCLWTARPWGSMPCRSR
jgi:hypothetical protein